MALNEVTLRDVLRAEFVKAERIIVSHDYDFDTLDSISNRFERLYGYLVYIYDNGLAVNVVKDDLMETMRRFINCIKSVSDMANYQASSFSVSPVISGKGRPHYDLPRDQLVYLVENGFTCSKISNMLGISQRTIYRRMSEYDISIRQMYSNITDAELKEFITEAHSSFPNAGYRFIRGWLMQKGLRVQEQRVRVLMREIDPVGVTNRFFQSIRRRVYSVAGSQALWHLDGNHKLIRYL